MVATSVNAPPFRRRTFGPDVAAAEHVLFDRGLHDPRTLFELRLELAASPARVAGEHAQAPCRAATRSESASAAISPMSAKTIAPASSWSSHSARTTTDSFCTGPPTETVAPGSTTSASSGTASATSASVGRLSTRPTAPSSSCATTSTTVRRKFGSISAGEAIRSCPRSDSVIRLRRSRSACRRGAPRPPAAAPARSAPARIARPGTVSKSRASTSTTVSIWTSSCLNGRGKRPRPRYQP